MENRKLVRFVVPALLLGLFVYSPSALAYGVETHAALTLNIFDFYNRSFPDKKIPDELKDFLVDGSRHEDSDPRYMNHFYDPVKDRGLESAVYGNGYKSKEWAVDKNKQNEAKYKIATALASVLTAFQQKKLSALTTETDFTWERAIRFWVNGDKEKAMYILGHTLHLVEDASVPDHTRNDPHPGHRWDYSPYENFTKDPEIYNKDISTELRGRGVIRLATLAEYFDSIAKYSNNNFYSNGTIGIQSGYALPQPTDFETEDAFIYALNKNGDGKIILYKQPISSSIVVKTKKEIIFDAPDVMNSYWNLLSIKSIQYGAGVVDLFFKEVEKEKNDPNFVKEEKTMLGQIVDAIAGTYDKVKTLAIETWNRANGNPSSQEVIEISLDPEPSTTPMQTENAAPTGQTAQAPNVPKQSPAPLPRPIDEEDEDAKELAARLLAQEPAATSTTTPTAPKTAEAPKTTAPAPKQCSFAQGGTPSRQGAILNEVAWMGTVTSANDEWLELKNISGAMLDIAGWQLLDQGEQIKITFPSGSKIPASGYMLLERTDDSSVPNITADLIYKNVLSDKNEGLRLFNAQCALIDEVLAAPDWPAGNAINRLTMERDTSGFGWHSTTQYGGTPRRENSAPAPAVQMSSGGSTPTPATTAPTEETASTSTPPTSSAVSAATHVVISEIQAGIDGDAAAEFIELYNPTDQPVDLSGWELRKRTSAGTESNLVDDAAFAGIIPAKSFFLIASPTYAGSAAADLQYSATSATIAYTSNTIVLYSGDHASAPVVDEVAYASISAGTSIERNAVSDGACVSAQGNGEFLGNGCDTDSATDFETRTAPKPQNSQNLPEPRAAAAAQNPSISYSSSTMELVFNWEPSVDAAGATSTVAYEVQEYNSPGVVILNATSTNEFRKRIDEIGRDYHFSFQTFDAEGLGSATSTLDIAVPSFVNTVAWYEDPTATSTYRLEAWYDSYPFIPDLYRRRPAQTILVAYLNEEASKAPGGLMTRDGMQLATSTNPISFLYSNCAGSDAPTALLFLPDIPSWCDRVGDIRNDSLQFGELEDPHLRIRVAAPSEPPSPSDFLTLAYYSFSDSGGGNQGHSLVAVDKTRYYFQPAPPTYQLPAAPSNLEISATHDESSARSTLTLSWTPSTDPDSVDSVLSYEWSEEAASSTWQTLTLTGGPDSAKRYGSLTFPMGEAHTLTLRSVDETGLASATTSQTIALPPSPSCPETAGNAYYAIDCIRLQDNVVKVRWRLLSNPGGHIIPHLADSAPTAGYALHKNIDGNSVYPDTTIRLDDNLCNRSITPLSEYEFGRQYQRNFSSISGVFATDMTATSTFKFAIIYGNPCGPYGDIADNPQEYAVTVP